MSKPVFVLVPGAWHGPHHFAAVVTELDKAGYESIGVILPSVGAEPPHMDFNADVEAIATAIKQGAAKGGKVVLVMHSYGGVVGGEATKDIPAEHVQRLVYLSAFALAEGTSLMDVLGGNDLPWWNKKGSHVYASTGEDIFYADVPPAEASAAANGLPHHSYGTFFSKVSHAPWKTLPSTYIVCSQDKAIPPEAQHGMVAGAQAISPQSFDQVVIMDTSHSPFLSKPVELAKILIEQAQR